MHRRYPGIETVVPVPNPRLPLPPNSPERTIDYSLMGTKNPAPLFMILSVHLLVSTTSRQAMGVTVREP